MANKKNYQAERQMPGGRQDKAKVYVDELYFRHVDQMERWRQEYERCQSVESALALVSTLRYEEVDYASQLLRVPWKERTVPDFSHLLEKARIEEEGKYVAPVILRSSLLLILLVILIFSSNAIVLWVSGTGVVTLLVLLGILIQKRHSMIEKVLMQKQIEIDAKVEYEQNLIKEEKEKHENAEEERIQGIERLLTGEIAAIYAKIDQALTIRPFPFHASADIALYLNIPSVKIWLPPKSIIPTQVCALQSSGRPSFEEKEIRTINKQYFELCASISMRVMSVIYAHIPAFRTGYVYGMSKEGKNIECLFTCKLDRSTVETACNSSNGLAALQICKATFNCDTTLELLPIEVTAPEEWGDVEPQLVHNLHVNLFQ